MDRSTPPLRSTKMAKSKAAVDHLQEGSIDEQHVGLPLQHGRNLEKHVRLRRRTIVRKARSAMTRWTLVRTRKMYFRNHSGENPGRQNPLPTRKSVAIATNTIRAKPKIDVDEKVIQNEPHRRGHHHHSEKRQQEYPQQSYHSLYRQIHQKQTHHQHHPHRHLYSQRHLNLHSHSHQDHDDDRHPHRYHQQQQQQQYHHHQQYRRRRVIRKKYEEKMGTGDSPHEL